jgi:YVTN family beta-propeller protein
LYHAAEIMANRRNRLGAGVIVSTSWFIACLLLLDAPAVWSRRGASQQVQKQPHFDVFTVHLASGVAPWPRDIAIDETLGRVYLADGLRGTVTTILGVTWLDSLPVGQEATHVAVDSALDNIYVSVPDPYAASQAGEVVVIKAGEVITRIAAGGTPGAIAVDRNHNRVYIGVNNNVAFADHVLILQDDRIVQVANTAPGIVALAVDADRGRAYVLSDAGPAISIIDGTTTANVVALEGAGIPRDIAVAPGTGRLYVVGQPPLQSVGTVTVLSGTEIIGQMAVGQDPSNIAIHAATGRVYVSNTGSDTVSIIDDTRIVATVRVGRSPGSIAIDEAGSHVYVSNSGDGTTSVLIGTQTLAPIAAGGGPIAVDPARGFVYLTGNGVAVARANSVLGRLPRAAMPTCVAVNAATELAYVCNDGQPSLSVLHGSQLLATPRVAGRPRAIATDEISGWTYVAAESQVALLRGASVRAYVVVPAVDVAVDRGRGLAYAAGNGLAVISGTELLATVQPGDSLRHVAVQPKTGLAYASGGGRQDGFVTAVTGTRRLATIRTDGLPGQLVADPAQDRTFLLYPSQPEVSRIVGLGRVLPNLALPWPRYGPALDAAVQPTTGDLYVATRGTLARLGDNGGEIEDLGLEALAVTVDGVRRLVYATLRSGRVVVLSEQGMLATLPTGHRPLALAVNERTGRVYVTNYGADSVTMIEPVGIEPPQQILLRFPFVTR